MPDRRFSPGPFGHIRLLELSDEKGEWCGKLFADLGADVIKIEPPGGAPERQIGPFYHDVPHPERSLHFWHYNTSKRGITLNLKTESGRALFRDLVKTTDVLLETFAPGYLPSLGLGYKQLREINPSLIMCSLTSFGQRGPWRDFLGSDLIHLAAGGQMESCGYEQHQDPDQIPIAPGAGSAWATGSHYAFMSIAAAVYYRTLNGTGQYIDASVHSACALTTEGKVPQWVYSNQHVTRGQREVYKDYRCKDGKYVITGGAQGGTRMNPRFLSILAEWMDEHGLAEDLKEPQYQEQETVSARRDHISEVLERFCLQITSEEAYHGAQKRGFTWGAIRAPEDMIEDPHWQQWGFWVKVEHPEVGETITYPGPGSIYPASPWKISRRAPLIGEHNSEVFAELGLGQPEILVLRETGVV